MILLELSNSEKSLIPIESSFDVLWPEWSSGAFRKGQTLLRVPWKLVLRKEVTEEDPVLKDILQKWTSTDRESYTSQAIRLWLLHQAGHVSDWSPWFAELPKDIAAGAEALPLALVFHQSDAFRGTALQRAADSQLDKLRQEWGELKEFYDVSFERFVWAQAIISTRSSTLPMDGQVLCCLIPVVDFINHDFHPNADVRATKQGVELISCDIIPEGWAGNAGDAGDSVLVYCKSQDMGNSFADWIENCHSTAACPDRFAQIIARLSPKIRWRSADLLRSTWSFAILLCIWLLTWHGHHRDAGAIEIHWATSAACKSTGPVLCPNIGVESQQF